VTRELLKRGYSEGDIDKLWGRNFLRVLKEVERVGVRSPKS
jgi:membrane dipeptidase